MESHKPKLSRSVHGWTSILLLLVLQSVFFDIVCHHMKQHDMYKNLESCRQTQVVPRIHLTCHSTAFCDLAQR